MLGPKLNSGYEKKRRELISGSRKKESMEFGYFKDRTIKKV